MKATPFIAWTLLITMLFATGCQNCSQRAMIFPLHPINATFARHSNPIRDWTFRPFDEYAPPHDRHHYQLDKTVIDDYQQFVADQKFRYPSLFVDRPLTGFFEDGTGRRAITFFIHRNGTEWTYVLIYDQKNKRTKVIRYVSGYYMC
jgi:hypothetical protein